MKYLGRETVYLKLGDLASYTSKLQIREMELSKEISVPRISRTIHFAAVASLMMSGIVASGQGLGGRGAPPQPEFIPEGYKDHQNMMDQLGIKALRPGKSGSNPQTGKGFDEATANDWMPTMPEVLTLKDGTKVTSAAQWPKRRAEILEDFEREVYGRIPPNVPKVTWEVTNTTQGNMGGVATVSKTLVGHVDNSAFPEITVNIQANFTVPANAGGPVPILIEFGGGFGGGLGARGRGVAATGTAPATRGTTTASGPAPGAAGIVAGPGGGRGFSRGPAGPSWTQQALNHGWGYGYLNPGSVQADTGGNALRQGIIGLTNKGEPRKPEDWGALRAWGWGVSQLIDYFEAHPDAGVDAKKVGVEGVSRYGKAAIVAEAFEPRVAVALVASSGEGGVKLHRHDFGEAVENLTGSSEYHWMAGNFIKYGAKESKVGELNASNLPVDSHELIALCAPRPCFISYGIEANGDPKWVDAPGSYRAGILATPVYELLGKKGYGDLKDWMHAPLPPVDTLVGTDLAFRQHTQNPGHSAGGNFPTFFEWVGAYIKSPAASAPGGAK